MFQLMRNTHLVLGMLFVAMAIVFALSSVVFIYRPWLPEQVIEQSERVVEVSRPRPHRRAPRQRVKP